MLCPGVTPDWDDVPGSHPAVHSAHGSSNYVDERAPYTWQLIEGFRSGDAVFVVAAGPVPCAGAALKPLFLAADHWRRTGVLGEMTVTLIVPWPTIFGIPAVDDELVEVARRFGITVLTGTRVGLIDPDERVLHLDQGGRGRGCRTTSCTSRRATGHRTGWPWTVWNVRPRSLRATGVARRRQRAGRPRRRHDRRGPRHPGPPSPPERLGSR